MHPIRSAFSRCRASWIVALLLCCASDVAANAAAERLFPLRGTNAQSEARRRPYLQRRTTLPAFVHDTARNALLHERGLLTNPRRKALRTRRAKVGLGAVPDTVQVLLVRIAFETNVEPGLTSMSETGDFFLDEDPSVVIDPPPHDVAYFESHLLAMRSYYDVMSFGKLVVEGTVFPPLDEPSIKLSDVADFGPGAGGLWTLELLEEYFREAVKLLDQEAPLGFLDPYAYDSTGTRLGTIVFVHPGSDLQNDINRDSPNDLPTFFITLGDSIPIQEGKNVVRSGLIIPETTSQDGAIGGIQGALCHEFGHALGLPDWYNTRIGITVIGEWSLMDSGNAAFHGVVADPPIFVLGLLPTSLSAIDRSLLGWVDPYVLRAPADSVRLRPNNADESFSSDPTVALLPVSPDEYFLLENRRDLLFRRGRETSLCPYFNQDPDTGVVLWMSKDDDSLPAESRRNSGEYDFWIAAPTAPAGVTDSTTCFALAPSEPIAGFGVIVWHVDERPLIEGLPTNSVNWSQTHRATRVIEASGDFEIGDLVQPTLSFLGDAWNDPFRAGYKTELRAETVPNNWNSDWARTGWEIVDVRPTLDGEGHEIVARTVGGVAGWPRTFEVAPDSLLEIVPAGALAAAIEGLGPVLLVADSTSVHAFGAGGHTTLQRGAVQPASLASARFAAEPVSTIGAIVDGRVFLWSARWNGSALEPRAVVDVPGGAGERLVLSQSEAVGVVERADGGWSLFDASGNVLDADLDRQNGVREAGVIVGPLYEDPAWPGDEIALVSGTRVEFVSIANTNLRRSHTLPFAAGEELFVGGGPFDPRSMHAQVVVLHHGGRLRVVDPIDGVLSAFADLPADDYVGMSLGDVDGDGFLDLLASSATHLVGVNSLGARSLNTPRDVREIFALRVATTVVTPPLLVDVTGDPLPEILFATDLGLIYALDATAQVLPGYPRKALPDLAPTTLLVADLDGPDESLEVIGVSSINAAVFSLPGGGSGGPGWFSLGAGPGRTAFVDTDPDLVGDAGERIRQLERPFAAYPNPARKARSVHLRITARSAGPYEVRIFNLEGEQVWSQSGMTRSGVQEIEWSVGGLASGVYLCRFVSPAAGVTSPLVEPITLVR